VYCKISDLFGLRGSYLLGISLNDHCSVKTRRRTFSLSPGLYLYVGSALGTSSTSLGWRIRRHLSSNNGVCAKPRWHIDFLLSQPCAHLCGVLTVPSGSFGECDLLRVLSSTIGGLEVVRGFGSGDCRSRCGGHLARVLTGEWDHIVQTFSESVLAAEGRVYSVLLELNIQI
jgi:Uri superfamily endonuclease